MADLLFSNNASALLAASINSVDTTVQVASGFGALFPDPGVNEFFYITLENDLGEIEIMQVTARVGDNMTVVRGRDSTAAQAWTASQARVELRLCGRVFREFIQRNGDTMTGNLDVDGNEIIDALLTGAGTSFQAGEIAGVPLRGATGVTGNQIAVPANGVDVPTVGGTNIVLWGDDPATVFDDAGVLRLEPTTRVVVTPVLRINGSTSTFRVDMSHDDTDFNFAFNGTTDFNITGADVNLDGQLYMNDRRVRNSILLDFSVDRQVVTSTASTTIDYSAGQTVLLNLTTNITTFDISNFPPSGQGGYMRVHVESTGTRSITWPAKIHWAGGVEPTLTPDGVDIIDLWTHNGGFRWYGAAASDFK